MKRAFVAAIIACAILAGCGSSGTSDGASSEEPEKSSTTAGPTTTIHAPPTPEPPTTTGVPTSTTQPKPAAEATFDVASESYPANVSVSVDQTASCRPEQVNGTLWKVPSCLEYTLKVNNAQFGIRYIVDGGSGEFMESNDTRLWMRVSDSSDPNSKVWLNTNLLQNGEELELVSGDSITTKPSPNIVPSGFEEYESVTWHGNHDPGSNLVAEVGYTQRCETGTEAARVLFSLKLDGSDEVTPGPPSIDC